MKGIVSLNEIRPAEVGVLGSLGEPRQPRFEGEVKNVTVKLGQEAVLSCSVTSKGDFKVGWIKVSAEGYVGVDAGGDDDDADGCNCDDQY